MIAVKAFLLAALALIVTAFAWAHPEDDFCTPDSGMDPALCRALAAADSGKPGAFAEAAQALTVERGVLETISLYVGIGYQHIIPMGLDHILFVVALAIGARRLSALLWQVSAFTLAHTLTLGLAAAGVVSAPGSIVEPLIAASIAFVALENVVLKSDGWHRLAVVFGFGLLHGLGFAGAFADLGLTPQAFWPGLLGFNIGVELGQLAVIAGVLVAVFVARYGLRLAGQEYHFRRAVVWPVSLAIAGIGLYWAVTRVIGG